MNKIGVESGVQKFLPFFAAHTNGLMQYVPYYSTGFPSVPLLK